jgi:hypothetical protein
MRITEQQAHQQWEDCLNQQGKIEIAGVTFDPAYILLEMDPVAYRTGFNDFCDAQGYDLDFEEEADGQPSEFEEWQSFDPDC